MDIRDRIIELRRLKASELVPNPKNWRKHPTRQREALRQMVSEIGFAGAELVRMLADGRLMLIDGHLRRDLFSDALLPVLLTDLNEQEADALLVTFDPIGAMAEAEGDNLRALLNDVKAEFDGVETLLDEVTDAFGVLTDEPVSKSGDPGATIERAAELREKYEVERPQLWQVGRHRVMCGDSYNTEQVALLLDGKTPDMLHTDPPYGINVVDPANIKTADVGTTSAVKNLPPGFSRGTTARRTTDAAERRVGGTHGKIKQPRPPLGAAAQSAGAANSASRSALIIQPTIYPVIEGDDRPFDPSPFIDFAPVVILWGANNYADKLPISQSWIVWDKREGITRNDFSDCELAWCNTGKAARCFHHLWNGLHKGSQHGQRRTHPTEKPVALFEEIGRMYADKGLWLDLFAGTGAQIVAAERSGATCLAMEYEPLYVAIILDRLATLGLEPARI